ncbi:protein RER1 isoform X1 [Bacillus rossius redtenbacheri]|uniref:protein RER1 isoform X1 n=1 Tax=Bacillus rossius redtenbacheri TaxID=93214 RepID=UPI002FDCFD35
MMQGDDLVSSPVSRSNAIVLAWKRLQQIYQKKLDDVTPYAVARWVFAALLTVGFLARIFILQGWYIVTYALGIYHLNLFIAFLTPKIDPALDFEDDGPALPTRSNEEFRPFIRRLPEFKFWYSVTKSTVIAVICTFFDCFNIPVFWPILVMYFFTLLCITLKRQIKHMIKYRYLPFTHSKPKYKGFQDTGKSENEAFVPGAVREE